MFEDSNGHDYRQLDDLRWRLLPEEEYLDSPFQDTSKTSILLYHIKNDPHKITRIEVFASGQYHPWLEQLLNPKKRKPFEIQFDKTEAGAILKARINPDSTLSDKCCQKSLNELISSVFSLFLVTGRPLRHYNCTFFLPLDLQLDAELGTDSHQSAIKTRESNEVERFRVDPPASLIRQGTDKIPGDDKKAHAQAYEFFYTHLQEQLFETTSSQKDNTITPIIHRRMRHETLKGLAINLVDEVKEKEKVVDIKVTEGSIEDVSLYEYYNGIYLLGIRLGLPENQRLLNLNSACWSSDTELSKDPLNELICGDDNWWRPLVYGTTESWETIKTLQVENWLRYTKVVRILFSSFYEQLDEKKIAPLELCLNGEVLERREVTSPFSPIALYFVKKFLDIPEGELTRTRRLKQVADERMFVHAAYALSGQPPDTNSPAMQEFDRLFSYGLYVDQGTDGIDPHHWAYDKTFTKALMGNHVLRRWQSTGSLSGYTDYSSVFMGFGSFFHNPTATIHAPFIYAKFQILVQFYRATLHQLDRRITQATRDLMDKDHDSSAFIQLRHSFIQFTNDYWFREITPQIQGKEISQQMMTQQSLDEKYELLKDEMDRAAEYTTSLKDRWFQKRADVASFVAGILAVGALLLACIDMTFTEDKSQYAWIVFFATVGVSAIAIRLRSDHAKSKKDKSNE